MVVDKMFQSRVLDKRKEDAVVQTLLLLFYVYVCVCVFDKKNKSAANMFACALSFFF